MATTYIITGYYGSGKTEFSLNLAIYLVRNGENVTIADLDIINPYFRSRQKANYLNSLGINIVGSALSNHTGQDVPAVSFSFISEINKGNCVILDLGGGEQGVKLLASSYKFIKDYEFLCVVNLFRKETDNIQKMIDFISSINKTCPLKINALVNNGNLLQLTTPEDILKSQKEILQVANNFNIPLKYTLINSSIYESIKNKVVSQNVLTFNNLQMRDKWQL